MKVSTERSARPTADRPRGQPAVNGAREPAHNDPAPKRQPAEHRRQRPQPAEGVIRQGWREAKVLARRG